MQLRTELEWVQSSTAFKESTLYPIIDFHVVDGLMYIYAQWCRCLYYYPVHPIIIIESIRPIIIVGSCFVCKTGWLCCEHQSITNYYNYFYFYKRQFHYPSSIYILYAVAQHVYRIHIKVLLCTCEVQT